MGNGMGGPSRLGRAETGQRDRVALDHIKWEQVERFFYLFWRNRDAWPVGDQQTRDHTRLLYPTAAHEDGTYTYA
jgi:hypothetical protein